MRQKPSPKLPAGLVPLLELVQLYRLNDPANRWMLRRFDDPMLADVVAAYDSAQAEASRTRREDDEIAALLEEKGIKWRPDR